MGSSDTRTPLTEILVERIGREGPLTFVAFMEACLYNPEHGYYTQHSTDFGDYFTSADTGPLFARLLVRQFAEMWERMERPTRFDLVECGAGRGKLAAELLPAAQELAPEFAAALRLTLVEASPRLRAEAETALAKRAAVTDALPEGVTGCMFSNELLDALPVHRLVQRESGLREIYVTTRDGELVEEEGEVSSPAVSEYLRRYGRPLELDQEVEVNLGALEWLEQAAAALERGFLLSIDYGARAPELYGPGSPRGTLLAYYRHQAQEDWLARPGRQDMTAHVNFTALEERGRELGLETLGYTQQSNFVLAWLRATGEADLTVKGWRKALKAREALKQLIHPEAMGERFKVLAQGKGVAAKLTGFEPL